MAMTQAESYADLWEHHRDRAGPVKADDVFALRDDRTFQPPSRGHLKRLQRVRPEVTPIIPRPALDNSRRAEVNRALAAGAHLRALLVKPFA